ncbi:hypothetical protein [Xanthomonas citri]|uniref:hypothetical protein n=1 Tax=Xanthomonas citri TaxID=346 RepID=UPI00103ED894|nr:hypothetical protein [Xanthomonas citri]
MGLRKRWLHSIKATLNWKPRYELDFTAVPDIGQWTGRLCTGFDDDYGSCSCNGRLTGKVDVSANVEGPKEADKTVSTKQVFVAHWQLAWNSCKNAHQNTKSLKMDHYDVLSRSTDGYFGVTSTWSCLDTP